MNANGEAYFGGRVWIMEALWWRNAATRFNHDCVKRTGSAAWTHLDVDLDRERDALLQRLGFLIEVFAELSDGDPSLGGSSERGKEICGKQWTIVLKCMRNLSVPAFSLMSLVSHCAARIQMPSLLPVKSIKASPRSDYIHTHQRFMEQVCVRSHIYIKYDKCMCCNSLVESFWNHPRSYLLFSQRDGSARVCVTLCCSRHCLCVCHSIYDWMHVGAQSQRNPVMNEHPIFQLLRGQPERKQNGWVTLSQHPANAAPLHHSSLQMDSVAKTNKESNYYSWNLNWPSPSILPKGNTVIEMFIFPLLSSFLQRGRFICNLIASRGSTIEPSTTI